MPWTINLRGHARLGLVKKAKGPPLANGRVLAGAAGQALLRVVTAVLLLLFGLPVHAQEAPETALAPSIGGYVSEQGESSQAVENDRGAQNKLGRFLEILRKQTTKAAATDQTSVGDRQEEANCFN